MAEDIILNVVFKAELELEQLTGKKYRVYARPVDCKTLNEQRIKIICCEAFNVNWEDVVGKSRKVEISNARHAFCYFFYKRFGFTSQYTAKLINRDRSNVEKSASKIIKLMSVGDYITETIKQIETKLYENKIETKAI